MSTYGSTTLGSLAIYDESDTLQCTWGFININFPDGFPYDVYQRQVEPVTGRGVDATRMRLNRNDSPRFSLVGETDFASFSAAVTGATALAAFKGYRAKLSMTAGGWTPSFSDYLYIWELSVKPDSAQIATAISGAATGGIVHTRFLLQFTKVA